MSAPFNKLETEGIREALLALLAMLEPRETVSFAQAVADSLRSRAGRRPRTLAEIRGVCNRLMRDVPGLAERQVQTMGRGECVQLVRLGSTARQQRKFRSILHGVFEHCRRQEWCVVNPMALIPPPLLREQEVAPLAWTELGHLLRLARREPHRGCMPALGLMLWAGIRPAEVTRMSWADLDWEEQVVCLHPRHSKTGGCRHIPLRSVLRRWLQEAGVGQGPICPPNWQRRWRHLRDAAGLVPWRQDVLRHTFASYHAKQFHDFARLQVEMGHRSAILLQTRYLSMSGVTAAHAKLFWQPGAL